MAYDAGLAERVAARFEEDADLTSREMFGGIGYMLAGNMACGIIGENLIVRVGPDAYEEALALKGAHVFDFTGRPMRGWVTVGADAVSEEDALDAWVDRGRRFARSLPPK